MKKIGFAKIQGLFYTILGWFQAKHWVCTQWLISTLSLHTAPPTSPSWNRLKQPHSSFLKGWNRTVLPTGIRAPLWPIRKQGQLPVLLRESIQWQQRSFDYVPLSLHSQGPGFYPLHSLNSNGLIITASHSMTALKDLGLINNFWALTTCQFLSLHDTTCQF